jgi:DNA polymerase-3 subunit delta
MDSLAFLENVGQLKPQPLYVLHGDEDFLKRQVLAALRYRVLETEDSAFGLSTYTGDRAVFSAIRDELETLPFLGARRLVVVDRADPFVTAFRPSLEKYAAQPSATGVLVLDVKTWVSTTKLSKLVPANATIACKALPAQRLPEWCSQWVAKRHAKKLAGPAARLLVELVGAEMGVLDQELTKLAIYVGAAKEIRTEDVDKLVGRNQGENIWKVFDAIGSARTAEALTILDRLFEQGEDAIRILGAFSMRLRHVVAVARLSATGLPFAAAVDQAGIPIFAQRGCEQQLRHLGRQRIDRLYEWLVELDLGLKGSSQLPPRTLLERLVIRLAR